MHLTSHITHSNVYTPYIAYHRSNGFHQLFRKLKPKPKLNPHNAHRSQIKICVSNVPNMPNVPNAFRILKPIQKSSNRVWVFRNTGANAFAKNQMRLAYEDKRDLYCTAHFRLARIYTPVGHRVSGTSPRAVLASGKFPTRLRCLPCDPTGCLFLNTQLGRVSH